MRNYRQFSKLEPEVLISNYPFDLPYFLAVAASWATGEKVDRSRANSSR